MIAPKLALLPDQPGVCQICRYWTRASDRLCESCRRNLDALRLEADGRGRLRLADAGGAWRAALLPIAFRHQESPGYAQWWKYKAGSEIAPADVAEARRSLTELLLVAHQHTWCLQRRIYVPGGFTHVSYVPSKHGRPDRHPLAALIEDALAAPVVDLVDATEKSASRGGFRRASAATWQYIGPTPAPTAVLLFDDLWTSGSSMLSALRCLLEAGVSRVGMVALGRHMTMDLGYQSPGRLYEVFAASLAWQGRTCVMCDRREVSRRTPSLYEDFQRIATR